MPYFHFQWTPAIVDHLDQHGVSPDEFVDVVSDPDHVGRSQSTGELAAEGIARTGRYLFCVYRMIDELTVEPITAYEIGE
jgi:uncharacterized DUF497 family protein